MAPEIILNKGYCHSVDWWALGIMLYELMYGRTPFVDNDPYKIMKKIVHDKILFPKDFDHEAKNLIRKLTSHDLSKRYGSVKGTIDKMKNHCFFKYTDWQAIIEQRHEAVEFFPPQEECCDGNESGSTYEYS